MTFYFCILFVTILLCFIRRSYKVTIIKNCLSVNISHVLFCSVVLFLTFIVGFRDTTVGTDTSHYAYGYTYIASRELNLDVLFGYSAPLYTLLCKGLSYISIDDVVLRIVSAIITYFCFYKLIKKSSPNPFISLYLLIAFFYFTASMNASRQVLATSIACLGLIQLLKNNKVLCGFLLLFVASAIHLSVAVFFIAPITFFLFKKLNLLSTFILSLVLAILVSIAYKNILTFFSDYFIHYKLYTSGDRFNVFYTDYKSNLFPLYLFYFECIVIYVLSSLNNCKNQTNKVLLPLLTFASVFGILNPFNEIIFRVVFPIFFLMIIFIPNTVYEQNCQIKTLLITIIFFVGFACFTYSMLRGWHGVIPYTSIFSKFIPNLTNSYIVEQF